MSTDRPGRKARLIAANERMAEEAAAAAIPVGERIARAIEATTPAAHVPACLLPCPECITAARAAADAATARRNGATP